MIHFYRGMLRVLRGLADGSYSGWTPRVEDLCRLQLEAVMYIDKDGFVSSTSGHGKPNTRVSAKTTGPPPRMTAPPTKQGAEQLSAEQNGTTGVEPGRPDAFSPIDFLATSMGFSFGTPVSSPAKGEGSHQPLPNLDGNGTSSLLSMEFVMYNDLMTDIGGSASFFDQGIRDSVLFGSTPTPLSASEDTGSVQGMGFQSPDTMYG
jgi:hypothetical protein